MDEQETDRQDYAGQEYSLSRRDLLKSIGKAAAFTLAATSFGSIDRSLEGNGEEEYQDTIIIKVKDINPTKEKAKDLNRQFERLIELGEDHFEQRYELDDMERALLAYQEAHNLFFDERYQDLLDHSNLLSYEERTKTGQQVKNKLAQLNIERSFAYYLNNKTDMLSSSQIADWFETSQELGIESLALDSERIPDENNYRKRYCRTINQIDSSNYKEEDLMAMLAHAHGIIGSKFYSSQSKGPMKQLNETRKVFSSYKNVKKLDENFFGGHTLSSLGAAYTAVENYPWDWLTGGVPFLDVFLKMLAFPGSSLEKAEELCKDSVENNEDFLLNKVIYGGVYAASIGGEEGRNIYQQQIPEVVAKRNDEEIKEEWPFWNRVAITLADDLMRMGYEDMEDYYQSLF